MRFLHLADLHFGKSIHGVSLLESGDQPQWVERFLKLAEETAPDAVVIAGDVYDRSAPSGDAVALLDRMVTGLAALRIPVLMVAGNHDSGQRLSFGGSLLAKQNIHIAGVLTGELTHVTLPDTDGNGPVTFWLMPYVFPALVSQVLVDDDIRDYDTSVRRLLSTQNIDFSRRNVIVAHQNVTAGGVEVIRGGSESMVGGVGQVDYTAFDGFEYAALGHIHAACPVGRASVRYAGSPLCYHFSETRQPAKGPVLVELGAKGTEPRIETLRIPPLHPMREVRGTYPELRDSELQGGGTGEYIRVVLTDRRVTPEERAFFQDLYDSRGSVLMELVSEYDPFGAVTTAPTGTARAEKAVERLFAEFYAHRNEGESPSQADLALLEFAGEQVRHADDLGQAETQRLIRFALEQEAEA